MSGPSAPYWGDLESPVETALRQNSVRRAQTGTAKANGQNSTSQSRPNRASVQSQATTVLSDASSFRPDGLAPRPPSFPYDGESYNKDYLDRRRRRASREADNNLYDSRAPPPPAAPDAPPPVAPSSYKQSYGNGETSGSYQSPVRSRSSRKTDGPIDAADALPEDYYRDQRRAARAAARAEAERIERGQLRIDTTSRRDRKPVLESPARRRDDRDNDVIRQGSVNTRKTRPESQDPEAQNHRRKGSAAEVEGQRHREWAPDRSPLQRLELTLDSITKEEKRARVEEAELVAREARAGRGGQNSVQGRNLPVDATQPEPKTLPEAGLVRNLSTKQRDELQRSSTLEKSRPPESELSPQNQLGRGFEYQPQLQTSTSSRVEPQRQISTSSRVEPQRQTSSSSRVEPQRQISTSSRVNEKAAVLPQRGPSFRERAGIPLSAAVAGAVTGTAAEATLNRTGSNKLKKNPPGDPWYSQRQEAEKKYQQIDSKKNSIDIRRDTGVEVADEEASESAPVHLPATGQKQDSRVDRPKGEPVTRPSDTLPDDDLYDVPVQRNSSKKISQLTGHNFDIGSSKVTAPQSRQQVATKQQDHTDVLDTHKENIIGDVQSHRIAQPINGHHAIPRDASVASHGQERLAPGHDGHHHFSDLVHAHNRRSQYRPGDGIYAPSERLNEWKTAGVAGLTGALLDLDSIQTEAEKDRAWWEAGHTSKRRPSTKKTNSATYDGGSERRKGTVTFYSSRIPGEEPDVLPALIGAPTWKRDLDAVVPRARQYIGFQGTSKNQGKVQRRDHSWLIKPQDISHQKFRATQPSSLPLLPATLKYKYYSSDCSNLSSHNIFHPFHICSAESKMSNSRLTPWMRYIRIRSSLGPTTFNPPLFLKCGPLLRYTGIRKESKSRRPEAPTERSVWRGSVMIVTEDAKSSYNAVPTLRLFAQPRALLPPPPSQVDGGADVAPEYVDPIAGLPKIGRDGSTLYVRPVEELEEEKDISMDETEDGLFEKTRTETTAHSIGGLDGTDGEKVGKTVEVKGFRLHSEQGVTFWRFNIEVELLDQQQRIAYRINRGPSTGFWVPGRNQTMNIMFHSCNGFSLSVNPDQFSGPDPMWRDVLNTHQTQPFHVMIGGGDQLYNDKVMRQTTIFQEWLAIKNPLHKHNAPFTPQMQAELETFYLDRYAMWFSQGLFGLANSQIPMVNIFDDHDIIDGFGSYPEHFMDSPVFTGLGAIAFKYYMLFQHQSSIDEGEDTEPSWLLGHHPGPYIKELSRSVFMSMGKGVVFLGLDCRTERSRDEILSEETTLKFLKRCHDEIVKGEIKHLILLLGVPIAYPRLVWLENILTSRLMDPVKAMGRAGMFGGFLNKFDGGVEILDDLDDHWTAKNHKAERNDLILDLQDIAAAKSVRVTILGGDVHLAAIGQFFSNSKLRIPKHRDFRYMPNVISSAIVNTPPPEMMADILNKRNKIHHLDEHTDENMIPIFTHDVTGVKRNNKCLLPRRNWCSIRPYDPEMSPPPTPVDERSPSPARRGVLRRFSSNRGPSYRPDAGQPQSRPPISRGLRSLSFSRGRTSSDSQRPESRRSFSLSRAGNFLGFGKRKPDDGGINGYGYESNEEDTQDEQIHVPRIRGGAGEPEDLSFYPPHTTAPRRHRVTRNEAIRDDRYDDYYDDPPVQPKVPAQPVVPAAARTQSRPKPLSQSQAAHPRPPPQPAASATPPQAQAVVAPPPTAPRPNPFKRTPTGLSERQRRKGDYGDHDVNLEGGLEITLNVEVSQKDPAGITVPYRLLLPALFYDEPEEHALGQDFGFHHAGRKESTVKRLLSFGRGKGREREKERDYQEGEWSGEEGGREV